jgi:transposase-like protein
VNIAIETKDKAVCKNCGSKNTRKYGVYKDTQHYFCNDCRREFSANDKLFKMKTPANQVSSALDMYYKGLSVNDIRDNLNQQYGNNPSSKTIYEWIEKYTPEAVKYFRDFHPEVGNTWIADETMLKIAGKNIWMYDIIDEKTRFLLATQITERRTIRDAQTLLEKAERKAGKKPKLVITDKQNSYVDGMERAYGSESEHLQSYPFAPTDDTQRVERFHGTLKERTKVMRGLKNIESAIEFIDGFLVYYNYLKPHESLDGKTPAEEAKINYPLKSWVDITRNMKPQVRILVTPAQVSDIKDTQPFVRTLSHKTYDIEH